MKIGLSGRPSLNCLYSENTALPHPRLSAYLASAREENLSCLELPYSLIFSDSCETNYSLTDNQDKLFSDIDLLIRISERISNEINEEISMCNLYKSKLATISIRNVKHCRSIVKSILKKDMQIGLITKYDDEETMNCVIQECSRNLNFMMIPFMDLAKHRNWSKKIEHNLRVSLKRAHSIVKQRSIFLYLSGESKDFDKFLDSINNYEKDTGQEIILLFSSKNSLKQGLLRAN